jgi:hypothetical protein
MTLRCQSAIIDYADMWVNCIDVPRLNPQRPIPHVLENNIIDNTLFVVLRREIAMQIILNDWVTLRYVPVEWVPLNKSIN